MWTLADFDKTRWTERNLGAMYAAKHGDDRNDGHPRRPAASAARAIDLARAAGMSSVIVASGNYAETLNLDGMLLRGDGFVTFDGGGAPYLQASGGYFALDKLNVQNYLALTNGYSGFDLSNTRFNNLNFFCRGGGTPFTWNITSCLLVNAPRLVMQSGTLTLNITNSTLIGSVIAHSSPYYGIGTVSIKNTYIDPNSTVNYRPGSPFAMTNCNHQGTTFNCYSSEQLRLADFLQQNPGLAVDCLSVAPGFNNVAASDYTLAATSQMRNLAFDGGFVGAYGLGINFSGLADAEVLTNTQWNNTLGAFVLVNPDQVGTVEFAVKDFQRNWILEQALLVGQEDEIDHQTIDATLSYDVDGFGMPANVQSGGLERGRTYWVTDYDKVIYLGQEYLSGQFFACTTDLTYSTVGSGKVVKLLEAPNIRLYEFKYSITSAADCVNQPWRYFQFGKVPTVDAAGRSNGDVLFDPSTANPITVRYPKLRLTIMPKSLA